MPSRVIRGGFNSSESMAERSLLAELMFVKLILAVDDYGRLDARTMILRGLLYPMRDNVTREDVASWLHELCTGNDPPVELYEIDGKPYLYLSKWETHRGKSKRGSKSRWPAPEDDPGYPRGSAEALRDPPGESGSRGSEESGKRGNEEVVHGADAPTPLDPRVSGFVSMLTGQVPVGLAGETWDSPREWLYAHTDTLLAEAEFKAGCESGKHFNAAFKSIMHKWWNSKAPPVGKAREPTARDRRETEYQEMLLELEGSNDQPN